MGTTPPDAGVRLDSADELRRRPPRAADYETESRALGKLAEALSQAPDDILQRTAELLLETFPADSAGLCLPSVDGTRFDWPAIDGTWKSHAGIGTPRNAGPCAEVLDRDTPLLFMDPRRWDPLLAALEPPMIECLMVPFHLDGRPIGTIWISTHDDSRHPGRRKFDSEDLRLLVSLAGSVAAAFRMTGLIRGEALVRAELASQPADLIERKDAEEAVARLAAIVESSDDAIVGKDLNGIITSWNIGAERLFGYTADEVIGRPVALLIPPDRVNEEPGILERIRRDERIDHYETVRRRKDGTLVDISITVSPIRNRSGRIIGAAKIARDITDRRLAEEALRESDRRKSEFLAMLAHELRGPLAPIRNALHVVLMRSENAEAVASAAAMMERQVGHMARLIDDLIDVSRISRGKLELRKEPIELTAIVKSVAEAAVLSYESLHHELTVSLPPEPIYLNADATRLAQVVSNLLHNAFKFTDRGGRLGLAVVREGEEAVIRVSDTGIGIAADNLGRIFEMFSQIDSSLERSRGGLGIGLSLVRSLVELHGGVVTVHSAGLGKGCEFIVRLPVQAESYRGAARETSDVKRATSRHRILVVDDNYDSAESLAMLLKLKGHEVQTAHDGLEAVEVAAKFQPKLILLDIGLPRLNGYEAARLIRGQLGGERIKLVALSGWGQEEDRRRSAEAGFDTHLVKPIDPERLHQLVATLS